ncbi:E3 ubiquitin-protein ligase WAV3 isoform X2 [Beta vulgaris subsp. vulgaris]|uniref:E3 ubiquitin-protein ligase WAV3 isoform X2 n=1 Tax=Beta vulgaris subsp. vulgaris TaxID=3555 RepID=UPI00053F8C23|nr:E3 ubiquitin-protein ligase WAV3 isoform X2 [Beta vulgaris subsp. vulgaris]
MASLWRKAKLALCYSVPRSMVDDDRFPQLSERVSHVSLLSQPNDAASAWMSRSSSRKRDFETCSICLATMKPGEGHAIFTAECSHSFHFHCITSKVKQGNQICPVCRAKWKEIPSESPDLDPRGGRSRVFPADIPMQNNAMMTVVRRLPSSPRNSSRHVIPLFHAAEPAVFDDDEPLGRTEASQKVNSDANGNLAKIIGIRAYPEFSSVPRTKYCNEFTVLINLKAAVTNTTQKSGEDQGLQSVSRMPRTPVDLVTVLDISGSMAGTKLALLKRAMGFVIHNMSSNDRLSVVTFSSTARRLFPLCRMSESGRQQALLAVNSLVANGGTNIAEGLRKGAKVMEERREKNPVASLILLSDGQDTYTVNGSGGNQIAPIDQLLLPLSIQDSKRSGLQIPVHTFGFGADHDSFLMHSISENSGGTFSFIETEGAIQDAFAQCIGGLLSVVVQEVLVEIECIHPSSYIQSVKAGGYSSQMMGNGRLGVIDIGDLYADEERDFLVQLNLPIESSGNHTSLLKVKCFFKDALTKESFAMEGEEVIIGRPDSSTGQEEGSILVDRQRNRLRAAEAMSLARAAAENGSLGDAISVLENCREMLVRTISAKSQDRLCVSLDAELKEMQERMASRHVYEASGRAYVLSGLSSHSWQRATARGDSTDSSSLIQAYQTPSMVEMLNRSQATLMSSPGQRLVRPGWQLNALKPR